MNGNDNAGDNSSPASKNERPRSRIMDRKIRPSGFSAFSPGKQGRRIPSRDRSRPPPPAPSNTATPAVSGAATPSTPENAKGRGLNVRDLVRRIEKSGTRNKPVTSTSPGEEAISAAKDKVKEDRGAATMSPLPGRGDGAAAVPQTRRRRFPLPLTTPVATPPPLQQQQDGLRSHGFRRYYDDTAAAAAAVPPPPVEPLVSTITTPRKKTPAVALPPPSPIRDQVKRRRPPPGYSLVFQQVSEHFNSHPLATRLDDVDGGAGQNIPAARKEAAVPQKQQQQQQKQKQAGVGYLKTKKSALDVFGISLDSSKNGSAAVDEPKPSPKLIASSGTDSSTTSRGDAVIPIQQPLRAIDTTEISAGELRRRRPHREKPGVEARDAETGAANGRGSSSSREKTMGPAVEKSGRDEERRGRGPSVPNAPRPSVERKPTPYPSSIASIASSPPPVDVGNGNGTPRWRSLAESKAFWEGVRTTLFIPDDEMDEYSQRQDEARWLRAREAHERAFWQQQQQQQQQAAMASTSGVANRSSANCAQCAADGTACGLATAFPTPPPPSSLLLLPPVTPWDPAAVAHKSAMVTPLRANFRRHESGASARSTEEMLSELTDFLGGDGSDVDSPWL